ncbi:hypothetical protein [Microtetraspora sp. NBRC 16547]|uniref:hypothetical protein n=1 Tax=Microtetraspora sp. NBRC 16547 TaxID=3030993 RepID=UPI0025575A80|nr:hypothetical protein [Microtetraspora sp. NBRC 16547]
MSEMDSLGETAEELSIETPEADAVEQHQRVKSSDETRWPDQVPIEADPADATDQERVVEQDDEEDYR